MPQRSLIGRCGLACPAPGSYQVCTPTRCIGTVPLIPSGPTPDVMNFPGTNIPVEVIKGPMLEPTLVFCTRVDERPEGPIVPSKVLPCVDCRRDCYISARGNVDVLQPQLICGDCLLKRIEEEKASG